MRRAFGGSGLRPGAEMVHQQARGEGQGGEVAGHQADVAQRPGVGEAHAFQVAHAVHQREGAARHDAHAQAVVDHAAHGVEAGDVDAQADRAAHGGRGLAHRQVDRAVGMQADVVEVQRVLEGDGLAPGQRMAARHDQHQFVVPVGQGLQLVAGRGGDVADAQVRRAFVHRAQHLGAEVLLQVDLHLRMLAAECPEILRQELHDGRDVGVDAHVAAHAVGVFGQLRLHLLQAEQDAAGVVQQAFARRRQLHAARVAIEQGRLERGFQVREALAHGGGGDELALRGAADRAQLADSDEELQRGQVDPAGEGAFGGAHGPVIAPGDGER